MSQEFCDDTMRFEKGHLDLEENHEEEDLNESEISEEETRSRHSSSSRDQEAIKIEPPVVESFSEPHESISKSHDENNHHDEPKKTIKPLAKLDFTQQQNTAVKKEIDENDWAVKNKDCGKIKGLISLFNNGTVLNEKPGNGGGHSSYKSDYGVGQGKGRVSQNVFH